jgi:hypothetical protein
VRVGFRSHIGPLRRTAVANDDLVVVVAVHLPADGILAGLMDGQRAWHAVRREPPDCRSQSALQRFHTQLLVARSSASGQS